MNITLSDTVPVRIEANPRRKRLLLQNQESTAKAAIAWGDPLVTIGSSDDHDGHVLIPGDSRLLTGEDATAELWVIADTNAVKLNVVEGF